MPDLPPLLTVPAALDLLHVSRRTLSRLMQTGEVPRVHVGRGVRIPRDELLTRLGLLSKRQARRLDRQAQAEMYAALAAVGGRA